MKDAFVSRTLFVAMMVSMVTELAAAAAAAASKPPLAEMPQYDNACMSCLCKAVGKNGTCVSDLRQTCVHLDTFGPFCISLPFWIDAGKPVLPGDNKDLPGAFVRCVEEPFCAVRTIRGYMETGPGIQDCDKNGMYNCRDLILTHLHGRYNCKDQPDNRVTKLEDCMWEALRGKPQPQPKPQLSRPGFAPPRGAQASEPGGRGSMTPNFSAFPGDNWPLATYGRGSVGTGLRNPFSASVSSPSSSVSRNPFGIVTNSRNIQRYSFNSLQGGASFPWDGVGIPDRVPHTDDGESVVDHSIDKLAWINHKHDVQDAMDKAQRLVQSFARQAQYHHRNSMPFPDSDEKEGTSESSF